MKQEQVKSTLNDKQKLERTKGKMTEAYVNSCCNVKDNPQDSAYYYEQFYRYLSIYGNRINKIFEKAGMGQINDDMKMRLACNALGREADDVNRLARTIGRNF